MLASLADKVGLMRPFDRMDISANEVRHKDEERKTTPTTPREWGSKGGGAPFLIYCSEIIENSRKSWLLGSPLG
jgi:hypothetical protein